MTGKQSLAIVACAAVLILSLISTTHYELQSLTDSFSSSWETGMSTQRTTTRMSRDPTAVNTSEFHLMASSSTKTAKPKNPRWNDTGIDFGTILNFIFNSSQYAAHPRDRNNTSLYIPTSDHAKDVGYWFPEVLYISDADGIWCSQRHRDIITNFGKGTVKEKLEPTERVAMRALEKLQTSDKWPRLSQSLKLGFPFLAFYGDFTGCNHVNWRNQTVPLFTTAAAVDCQYAIPFPNYQTISDAEVSPTRWDEAFRRGNVRYPWHSKLPQVVWRGSLTGNVLNETHKSTRWTVLEEVHRISSKMFDVKATRLPKRHEGLQLNLSAIGGMGDGFSNMEDFQKYKAILDMDGNSWSSRFGKLMCFNSVVLKMKPRYVDYFFFDLIPWVHYIPVADVKDLIDKTKFALDPDNAERVRTIILEANAWCRRRMVQDQITEDILDIWESYIRLLDSGSGGPQWQSEWAQAKALILRADSPFSMKLLPLTSRSAVGE